MHRALLMGGPALVREARARVIQDAALLTVQAQIPALPDALAQLPYLKPDVLLIDDLALAPSPPATTLPSLRRAADHTALVVIGDPPAEKGGSLPSDVTQGPD
ncbi:hypothetical protein [Streptomyces sp. NBC_00203]|uniref:hypothetical protein n=1 Tax=Streptomyces sp. NBC_00203 TaxID=2975680 RepID=UPI0032562DA8